MNTIIQNFKKLPRISLSNLDTPIEECRRLMAGLGSEAELYIKRDDFIGPLVWGNKLRKLEYALADALEKGADTIITCGGIQSNHSRTTAQVCKRLGLDCILVQNGEKQDIPSGNHKINRLLNIPIYYVASREERDRKMIEVYKDLKASGSKPYLIPLGASNEFGCPGFIEAMAELATQQEKLGFEFDYIILASSSGGTQAGMELGKRIYGLHKLKIIGISADSSVKDLKDSIADCINPIIKKLGADFTVPDKELNVDTDFIGPGYGLATDKSDEAHKLFSDHEGILLDTCYTAKAAAAIIDYTRNGKFKKGDKVLFWHTGGILALL